MRLRLCFDVIACLTVVSIVSGCAVQKPADAATIKAIQIAYDEQTDAYNRKDADGVLARCSPQYEEGEGEQVNKRDQYSETLHAVLTLVESCVARATVKTVTCENGEHCTAIVDRHFEYDNPPSSSAHLGSKIVTDLTDKDVWEKDADKGWLIRRSVILHSDATNKRKTE